MAEVIDSILHYLASVFMKELIIFNNLLYFNFREVVKLFVIDESALILWLMTMLKSDVFFFFSNIFLLNLCLN